MEIHNISEDIVFNSVQTIFEEIKKGGNPDQLCLCKQCKLDTICFVLNRVEPRYIVSNRGITRIENDWVEKQQSEADIAALVYKGLRMISHNQRPTSKHTETELLEKVSCEPTYNIPTIIGRIFDGKTFTPFVGATVELRSNKKIVPMRNSNWQNPYTIVSNTPGTFTFWPAPISADKNDQNKIFEFSVKVEAPEHETLTHFFVIHSTSGFYANPLDKTFKLPDLYLFPPGEAECNEEMKFGE
ncbi:MAG: late competence development ComFB family protein [Treponema sp.]|nr:late competence development ComFB family protein [Treponema sp.]